MLDYVNRHTFTNFNDPSEGASFVSLWRGDGERHLSHGGLSSIKMAVCPHTHTHTQIQFYLAVILVGLNLFQN